MIKAIVAATPGKGELIDYVGAKAKGVNKETVKLLVDAVLEGFVDFLANQGVLRIQNFGTFTMRKIEAHKGRNPKTGEVIDIPAIKKVAFKMSGAWKDDLNKAAKNRAAKKAAK